MKGAVHKGLGKSAPWPKFGKKRKLLTRKMASLAGPLGPSIKYIRIFLLFPTPPPPFHHFFIPIHHYFFLFFLPLPPITCWRTLWTAPFMKLLFLGGRCKKIGKSNDGWVWKKWWHGGGDVENCKTMLIYLMDGPKGPAKPAILRFSSFLFFPILAQVLIFPILVLCALHIAALWLDLVWQKK